MQTPNSQKYQCFAVTDYCLGLQVLRTKCEVTVSSHVYKLHVITGKSQATLES